MSKLTLYIDENGNGGFQVVTVDEAGQVGSPIPLTDEQLLDLNAKLSPHVRTAWQRFRVKQSPPANFPNPPKG